MITLGGRTSLDKLSSLENSLASFSTSRGALCCLLVKQINPLLKRVEWLTYVPSRGLEKFLSIGI